MANTEIYNKILSVIKKGEYLDSEEISKRTGLPYKNTQAFVASMVFSGFLGPGIPTGTGQNRRKIYGLPKEVYRDKIEVLAISKPWRLV